MSKKIFRKGAAIYQICACFFIAHEHWWEKCQWSKFPISLMYQ